MLKFLFISHFDIVIVIVLLMVTGGVFAVSRFGMLTKKTVPFIVAGLIGTIGISVMGQRIRNAKLKEIDDKKKDIDNKKTRLDQKKEELNVLTETLEEKKKHFDKKDQMVVELIAKKDEASETLQKAEAALEKELKNYAIAVKETADHKKEQLKKIEAESKNLDSMALLEELLKEAKSD